MYHKWINSVHLDRTMIDLNRMSGLADCEQLTFTCIWILEHSCIIIEILSWLLSHVTYYHVTIFARDCIMSKIQLRNLMISIEKAILEMVKVKLFKFKFILNGHFSWKPRKLGYLSINITIWRDFLGLLWKDKICATKIYHFFKTHDLFIESMMMNFPLFRSSIRTWSQELDSIHSVDE